MRTSSLLVLALGAIVCGLPAQNAGDLITVETLSNVVYLAPRGGTPGTMVTLPSLLAYGPMIAGAGDDSVLLVGGQTMHSPTHFVLRVDASTLTTLSTFAGFPSATADMALDDGGDLLLLAGMSGARNGLYVAPLAGASTLSLVASWPGGAAEPVAFTESIDTGAWWVLDRGGYVHRLSRGGAVLSIVRAAPTSITVGDLVMDPVTGDLLIAAFNRLMRFDPAQNALSTVINLGFPQGGAAAMGLHFDQLTRGYLFSVWMGFGPGTFGFVHELDSRGTSVRTTSYGSPRLLRNVVAAWGRAFTPLNAPAAGTTYRVELLSRADAGQLYQAALAFTSRPGIATPLGPIPLTPDALFFLSIAGGPFFQNFAGVLDSTGRAQLGVVLPPGLGGLRPVMAAVVVDRSGLRRILGPHGFTIR